MTTEIRVPALGESVTEATIGRWFKQPGEAVAVDEPVVELETDKVTIEVPAPAAGVLPAASAEGAGGPPAPAKNPRPPNPPATDESKVRPQEKPQPTKPKAPPA